MPLAIALLALLATAAPARAQSDNGAVIGGAVAATVFGSGTEASVSGAISYRLNRVLGFGIEATWLPSLRSGLPDDFDPRILAIWFAPADGSAVFFGTNVRLEIPIQSQRIVPFAVAGGGGASFTQRYAVTPIRNRPFHPTLQLAGVPTVVSPNLIETIPTIRDDYASSATHLMLTLGGGVSLLATRHVAIDVDLRTIYLHGRTNGTIGRFAAGASYRF
jgi:hypothetical protein